MLLLSYIAFKWIRILASLHLGLVLYIYVKVGTWNVLWYIVTNVFLCCRVGSYTIETNYAMLSVECVVLQLLNRFLSTALLKLELDICLETPDLMHTSANCKFEVDCLKLPHGVLEDLTSVTASRLEMVWSIFMQTNNNV